MSKGQKLADLLNQNIRRDSARLGPDLRTAIPRVAEMMYDNPLVNAAISLTPVVGDFQAAGETANSIRKGDTLGALLNGVGMLPFVPALGGIMKNKGMLSDLVRPKTEFEIRHEVAQRNAALPVEQGGLGLPPNNTAMDRAKAMGAIDAYHGTASDIRNIDKSRLGEATGAQSAKDAFWAAASPSTAEGYAHYAANSSPVRNLLQQADAMEKMAHRSKTPDVYWNKYDDLVRQADELEAAIRENPLNGQNVMPLKILAGKKTSKDAQGAEFYDMEGGVNNLLKEAKRKKNDFVELKNLSDDAGFNGRPTDHYGILNPSVVRSRFAAFDPFRRNESDLLAGVAPWAIPGGLFGLMMLGNQERTD